MNVVEIINKKRYVIRTAEKRGNKPVPSARKLSQTSLVAAIDFCEVLLPRPYLIYNE